MRASRLCVLSVLSGKIFFAVSAKLPKAVFSLELNFFEGGEVEDPGRGGVSAGAD
jgi:hypothetical protein